MSDHRFSIVRDEYIEELKTQAFVYRHPTGARLLSLSNDDENKVFGITFRTPPEDSTGIAHILEHSVLCGSRKFPVKEPFIELIKGSLNTFLNAFTYPDRTCYPLASTNLNDFYNLIDVYLDAVFYPRITPEVLRQEGWHYEMDETTGELFYKGVVFNEMKGAYSNPDSLAAQYAQQSLYPDTTYGVDSGGDPCFIPDLTFNQFKLFHEKFYHPSNSYIYFYGNDNLEKRLLILEDYLEGFENRKIESAIDFQPRFDRPRRQEHVYASDEREGKCYVSVHWLIKGVDFAQRRALHLLDYILLATSASIMRKTLIESGLGEDVIGGGFETELMEVSFGVGLKGVSINDINRVESLIMETIDQIISEGIDSEMVAAALNTTEFRLRENNTGSFPRGLALMLRSLTNWIYDRDEIEPLRFERSLEDLRTIIDKDRSYMEKMIQSYLKDNIHRSTVILKPDKEEASRLERAESQKLSLARSKMNNKELTRIKKDAESLRESQEKPDAPEDIAKLPSLGLKDLNPNISTIPSEEISLNGTKLLFHDIFTNGIVYFDLGFDLRILPQRLIPYIPLFGQCLLEMGTEKQDFVSFQQRMGKESGGLWTQQVLSGHRESDDYHAFLFLRGKTTEAKLSEFMDIIADILYSGLLNDRDRFLQIVLEEKANEEAAIIPGGHRVVATRLRSRFDIPSWVSEQMRGIDYLFFLRRLIVEVENDWTSVQQNLEELRSLLFTRNRSYCNVTMSRDLFPTVREKVGELLSDLPSSTGTIQQWVPQYLDHNEGLIAPVSVNYVGKAVNLFDYGYELDGSSMVITRYLGATWLWDKVRVQGGAYGAFCSFDSFSGVLTFSSYRDPNILSTLENFDLCAQFLRDLKLSEDELAKAIIGAIGDMDVYQLPDAKGTTSMMRQMIGIDDDYRQKMRDQVLETTVAQFHDFSELLLATSESNSITVLGDKSSIESVNTNSDHFLHELKIS